MEEYVGVDGCKAGWLAISLDDAGSWRIGVHGDFAALWANYEAAGLILVDIPIGLVDGGPDGRQCDTLARRLLSPRRSSSVFTPPARPTLEAPDYQTALALNRRLTGRGISIQSWNIAPKIREVDRFLRRLSEDKRRPIREVHPELLFWALNGRQAMVQRKSRLSGYEERLAVLRQLFDPAEAIAKAALARYRRSEVARDDILDALAAAVTGYLSRGELRSIPEDVPRDAFGLPMEMAYFLP